jgi:Amt family ammonium transporter
MSSHWLRYSIAAVTALVAGAAMADTGGDVAALKESIAKVAADSTAQVDKAWVLIAAVLVFFMQAGFLMFEAGAVRPKNAMMTALKNLGDWVVVTIGFWVVGFALMFGKSAGGLFGSSGFLGNLIQDGGHPFGWIFVLFQLAFAGTAATIVSGAMAERTTFKAYIIFSAVMGIFIYPVFGHWVWGNAYFGDNKPWLASMGFIDFAGSSVVHIVGGTASLIGIWFVGPRMGRFASDGTLLPMPAYNLVWTAAGTLILWLGWWGFNGGSTLALNDSVGSIIFNTNMAGAAAGITALVHCAYFQRSRNSAEKLLGGALAGLVAITANCHLVTPGSAIAIGIVAGLLHNISLEMLQKSFDDVVGAVPVHLVGGVWGILATAIFAPASALPNPFLVQLGVQALGAAACIAWTGITAYAAFYFIKSNIGIRITPAQEIHGITFEMEHGEDSGEVAQQQPTLQ